MEGYAQLDDQVKVTPAHNRKRTAQPEDSISKRRKFVKSYRVRGVPLKWGIPELHSFLDSHGDFPGLSIRSLALEIHGKWSTATITYDTPSSNDPTWSILLPASIGGQLTVDSDFFGFTTLYRPSAGHEVDILAISGLGGHAFGSFKEKNGEHMWLRDALPRDLTTDDIKQPIARVLLYGYESRILESDNTQDLEDIASAFCTSLVSLVKESNFKPMILIAHSLGGLVVKQTLISISESKANDIGKVARAIYGILFFGVPQAGMEVGSLLPIAKDGPNRPLIESINRGSKILGKQRHGFYNYLEERSLEVYCFYETMKSPTPVQDEHGNWARKGEKILLVDQPSATDCHRKGTSSTHICAIASNHSDMVKFSPHDHNYDAVLGRLIDLTRKAVADIQDPTRKAGERKRLIKLLSFDQIDERLVTLKPPKLNTCEWILKTFEYRIWIDMSTMPDEPYRLLWIKGKPGAGKSIIMKYLFQQKNNIPGAESVSFFFNARGNALERSTLGLYRALLLQLFEKIPDLQDALEILGFYGTKIVKWQLQSLKNVLLEAVRMLKSRVFCYIDALDECPEAEIRDMISFFQDIRDAATSSKGNFYVCFSSRHYPQISVEKSLQIILEKQSDHELDIKLYIDTELHIGNSSQATQVKQDVKDKASGVFLWVALVIPMLNRAFDHGELEALKTLLKELPPSLEDLIRDILTRDQLSMDTLLCCIQWVFFSPSPLELSTLYFAIKGALDDDDDNEELRWNLRRDFVSTDIMSRFILSASKGLVEPTRSENPTVQFIHESIRDFLIRHKGLQELWPQSGPHFEARSHDLLAQYCVKQIKSRSLNNTKLTTSVAVEHVSSPAESSPKFSRSMAISSFPFLEYAVKNALYHSNMAQTHGEDQTQFINQFPKHLWIRYHSLLAKYARNRRHNMRGYTNSRDPFYDECYPGNINLLYILAKLDLVQLIRLLPDRVRHLDIEGGHYRTPLLAALACGNRKAACDLGFQVFIDQGVMINDTQDYEEYFTSLKPDLYLSPRENDIQRSLLKVKCFPTINALILQGTNPQYDQDKSQIFSRAIRYGVWKTAELLLEEGADIEAVGEHGETPLIAAAAAEEFLSINIIEKLLKRGANIEAVDKNGRTPLLVAAATATGSLSIDIIKVLLKSGAHIEAVDKNGRTPLLAAVAVAGLSSIDNIKLLLKKGANIEAVDKNGRTPLLAAAAALTAGSLESARIIKKLLNKGANIEAVDKCGRTPLLAAAAGGFYESAGIVEQLLNKGANIEAVDKNGSTPLLAAAAAATTGSSVSARIVKQLLDHGANIEAVNKCGRTPLLSAAAIGSYESARIVEQLLNKGANIEAVDKNGCTPLLAAAAAGFNKSARIVEQLLNKGAHIEAVDKNGRTPLLAAAAAATGSSVSARIVKQLLDKGSNIEAIDENGYTPLLAAATTGSYESARIVEQLLDKGANIEAMDKNGRTPLLAAAAATGSSVSARIVKQLLNHGANIETVDKNSRTPLLVAAAAAVAGRFFSVDIIKQLLEVGANIEAMDKDGCAMLSVVKDHNIPEAKRVVELIQSYQQAGPGC